VDCSPVPSMDLGPSVALMEPIPDVRLGPSAAQGNENEKIAQDVLLSVRSATDLLSGAQDSGLIHSTSNDQISGYSAADAQEYEFPTGAEPSTPTTPTIQIVPPRRAAQEINLAGSLSLTTNYNVQRALTAISEEVSTLRALVADLATALAASRPDYTLFLSPDAAPIVGVPRTSVFDDEGGPHTPLLQRSSSRVLQKSASFSDSGSSRPTTPSTATRKMKTRDYTAAAADLPTPVRSSVEPGSPTPSPTASDASSLTEGQTQAPAAGPSTLSGAFSQFVPYHMLGPLSLPNSSPQLQTLAAAAADFAVKCSSSQAGLLNGPAQAPRLYNISESGVNMPKSLTPPTNGHLLVLLRALRLQVARLRDQSIASTQRAVRAARKAAEEEQRHNEARISELTAEVESLKEQRDRLENGAVSALQDRAKIRKALILVTGKVIARSFRYRKALRQVIVDLYKSTQLAQAALNARPLLKDDVEKYVLERLESTRSKAEAEREYAERLQLFDSVENLPEHDKLLQTLLRAEHSLHPSGFDPLLGAMVPSTKPSRSTEFSILRACFEYTASQLSEAAEVQAKRLRVPLQRLADRTAQLADTCEHFATRSAHLAAALAEAKRDAVMLYEFARKAGLIAQLRYAQNNAAATASGAQSPYVIDRPTSMVRTLSGPAPQVDSSPGAQALEPAGEESKPNNADELLGEWFSWGRTLSMLHNAKTVSSSPTRPMTAPTSENINYSNIRGQSPYRSTSPQPQGVGAPELWYRSSTRQRPDIFSLRAEVAVQTVAREEQDHSAKPRKDVSEEPKRNLSEELEASNERDSHVEGEIQEKHEVPAKNTTPTKDASTSTSDRDPVHASHSTPPKTVGVRVGKKILPPLHIPTYGNSRKAKAQKKPAVVADSSTSTGAEASAAGDISADEPHIQPVSRDDVNWAVRVWKALPDVATRRQALLDVQRLEQLDEASDELAQINENVQELLRAAVRRGRALETKYAMYRVAAHISQQQAQQQLEEAKSAPTGGQKQQNAPLPVLNPAQRSLLKDFNVALHQEQARIQEESYQLASQRMRKVTQQAARLSEARRALLERWPENFLQLLSLWKNRPSPSSRTGLLKYEPLDLSPTAPPPPVHLTLRLARPSTTSKVTRNSSPTIRPLSILSPSPDSGISVAPATEMPPASLQAQDVGSADSRDVHHGSSSAVSVPHDESPATLPAKPHDDIKLPSLQSAPAQRPNTSHESSRMSRTSSAVTSRRPTTSHERSIPSMTAGNRKQESVFQGRKLPPRPWLEPHVTSR